MMSVIRTYRNSAGHYCPRRQDTFVLFPLLRTTAEREGRR